MAEEGRTRGTAPAPSGGQRRDALLGGVLVAGMLLAVIGIVLLWQISDRVDNLERDQPLPPPSQGSARQTAEVFDRTMKQLERPLAEVREELTTANLQQLGPALRALESNTAAVPAAVVALEQLIAQTQGVNALGTGIAGLRGDLGILQRQIGGVGGQFPGLTGGLSSTRQGLAAATTTLGRVRGTLQSTNAGLDQTNVSIDEIVAALRAATAELERTRQAIDRNSQCLESPVLCNADNPPPSARRSR